MFSVCVPILTSSCHHFWCSLFVFPFLSLVAIISDVLCLCSHSHLWLPSFLMFSVCVPILTSGCHHFWCSLFVFPFLSLVTIISDVLFVFPFLPLVAIISDVLSLCSHSYLWLPSFLMFSVCILIPTSGCHHFWCSVCVPILTSSCHHFWCSLVFPFLPLVAIISDVLCSCSHSYL